MTTAEIIQLARDNSRFTLFKEGLFYKQKKGSRKRGRRD